MTLEEALDEIRRRDEIIASNKTLVEDLRNARYALEQRVKAEAGAKVIHLTPHEIQSGLDRVRWAELLIRQLPKTHDGRNSWLLNYAVTPKQTP